MNRHNRDHNRHDRNDHGRQSSYGGIEKMGRAKGSHFSPEDYDQDMEDSSSNYGSSSYGYGSAGYGSAPQRESRGQYRSESNYDTQDRYSPDHLQSSRYQHQPSNSMKDQPSNSMKGSMTGRGPKGYRRSDERIREDVCDALTHHGDIDASDIEVKVSEGTVTLSGNVSSRQMKRMIEDVSESISGIQDVKNEIKVASSMNRSENQDLSSSMTNTGERTSQSGKGSSTQTQTDKAGKH